MKLILDGVLENLSTRQDGSVKVSFATQELAPEQGASLFQLRGKYCKALFSDSNITELESVLVDAEKITGTKKKSQSQRLRAVLYRNHEQSGFDIDFENYYHTEMERIIEHYRNKLDSE